MRRHTLPAKDATAPIKASPVASGILQRTCACGQHTAGGECETCNGKGGIVQRHATDPAKPFVAPASASLGQIFSKAAAEASDPIHEPLRSSLGHQLGQDFSHVRVHSGPASADAADLIGARAYALGTDIHLGKQSQGMARGAFDRLIAHEAIHTVQQGGRTVAPHPGLTLSNPHDPAELEAERLAGSVTKTPVQRQSRSLSLRDRMRATMPGQQIARSVSPQIQRDLTGKHPTRGGDFTLNLKTESHPGAKSGMSGTIKFKASDASPDSDSIRLLQVARDLDLTTGKDYVWTGDEANRNKVMTTASPGVEPGNYVDQSYGTLKPRSKKTDAAISPYYIDYGNSGPANNYDGSKKGKTIQEASLWDYPGSSGNRQFSFETVAMASDTGHVYGTVMWGFTISDASEGYS